ncbi:unnamed protein product [Schistosoma bovis]|nr:unnamed protein product [Schistosoma bovis]
MERLNIGVYVKLSLESISGNILAGRLLTSNKKKLNKITHILHYTSVKIILPKWVRSPLACAANVVNSVKTRPRVLSLYRQIFRIARIWQANSGSVEDSSRQADYIKEEARTLFRQNAHITDEIEIENHIKEAEARIELTLHYGTPYPRLTNLPPNTLAAHMNTSTKGSTPPPSSSESFTTTNNSNSVHEKSRISRRTERALYESVPAYLKSYTYRPKK